MKTPVLMMSRLLPRQKLAIDRCLVPIVSFFFFLFFFLESRISLGLSKQCGGVSIGAAVSLSIFSAPRDNSWDPMRCQVNFLSEFVHV